MAVQAAPAALRGEFGMRMAEMIGSSEAKMADLRRSLRAEIHASARSVTRQMYAALMQMAVLLGIAYFFVTHAVP